MGVGPLRIQKLPTVVANQIAAGEVIERPASVVKELLENALDSGADVISIDIGFGGLNQIKICDNGMGIVADDLSLAILAHATSKISQLNDLYAITSMGFRGEALASIASVSRLSLSSKPAAQEHAMMLRFDGTEYKTLPCARSNGTTVEVQDLFYNAPVRKKFLKTARSEYQAIEWVVKRFALSAPCIAITLNHDGKQQLALPAATCEKSKLLRVKKLLGKLFIEQAVYLDVEQGGLRLLGWVSGRDYQRSQNDKQWVYINQRMVKDKFVNHAIKQAYEDMLHPGRYPACLLYFMLPPEEVDVNVHPTKHEVRFQQPRLIHDFILSTISQALMQQPVHSSASPISSYADSLIDMPNSFKSFDNISGQRDGQSRTIREEYIKQPLRAVTRSEGALPFSWLILNTHFVLVFQRNLPYLVDVKHLQQQRLLSILDEETLPLVSRPLLVPASYTIEKSNCHLLEQCQPMFKQLGIEIDWMGDTQVVVRALPTLFPQLDMRKVLQRLTGLIPTQSNLLKLLVNCQSFDVYQYEQEEKEILMDYLYQQLSTGDYLMPWCLRLDTETCRGILHA